MNSPRSLARVVCGGVSFASKISTSVVTRSFAVAVVASTGTPAGSSAMRVRRRR